MLYVLTPENGVLHFYLIDSTIFLLTRGIDNPEEMSLNDISVNFEAMAINDVLILIY